MHERTRRDRAERLAPAGRSAKRDARIRNRRTVAVLHAVAGAPADVVEQKRVVPGLELRNSPNTAICSRTSRCTILARSSTSSCAPSECTTSRKVDGVPSAFGTVNVLRTKSESSVGLSRKYGRFGAVNVNGSFVGNSCVPAFQFEPAGGTNVIRIGRAFEPRCPQNAAGMLRCACVVRPPCRCRRHNRRRCDTRAVPCRRARRRPSRPRSAAWTVNCLPAPS